MTASIHGPEWIPVIILAGFVWLAAFVAFWALVGWGASIAVRVYRRVMAGRAGYAEFLAAHRPVTAGRG